MQRPCFPWIRVGVPAIEPATALPDCGAAAFAADGAWVPPDTFERKSTKFWAHESVIPALQVLGLTEP